MKWQLVEPNYGDIVRVKIREIYHYGIYVSDDEIIQFGLPPVERTMLLAEDIKVCSSDIATFSAGGFLEVGKLGLAEKIKAFSPEKTVENARKMLGTGNYHLLYNNCEHFVYNAKFGEKKSTQIDDVRKKMSNLNVEYVYIAKMPVDGNFRAVSNEARRKEIESVSNEKVKAEKTFVWNVLEYALKDALGVEIENTKPEKNGNGKLICSGAEVSLSHKDGIVAVAVGKVPVGIDIEYGLENKEKLFDKILSDEEKKAYLGKEGNALLFPYVWTRKESVFKRLNQKTFIPDKINTTKERVKTYLTDIEKNCVFSVSTVFIDKTQASLLTLKNGEFVKSPLSVTELTVENI